MAWEYILCSLAVTSLALGVPPEENCTKDNKYCQPEQVHIAFGEKSNDITVTWSTMNNTYENEIDFINRSALKQMRLYITKFVDGGDEHHFQFIHTIILKDLDHDQLYVYKVGSQYGLSEKYSFRIPPKGDNYPVRALFFGDMGIPWGKQRKTLQALINEVKCRHYDVAVHNGDFAYDLGTDNAHHGDKFMNMIQPLAANIPYMTSPGNHEGAYNFSNYKNRFFMPGHSENMFYSFNLGPVHFVAVNTETYFRWQSRPSPSRGYIPEVAINGPFKEEVQRHFNWLKADLEEAAKKENRAPVHVTTGAAGNKEGQDGFYKDPHGWSAFRSSDYGYARLFVYNATHLHMEEVSTDDAGVDEKPLPKTIDEFWLIKTEHKPYDSGVWSLRNLSISVPRAVLSGEGQAAVLRCSYDLEGAALYSIRWYRAETEFYRYVPRELPPTMVFPLPGASVDLTQSDHQQVRVVNLNRRLSGLYQCEVSADAPLFHTDIASAPLTVVDPPFRAPRLHVSRGSYSRGDVIRANCSVDEAYPAPNITWLIDDVKIAESVSWQTSELDFKERATLSRLELSILETERYQVGLTYTSASLAGVYQHNHVYEYDREANSEERDTLRYTLSPPSSGQFTLSCVATIFDIYARGSEPAAVREDAPRPASVTGEDSAGVPTSASVVVVTWCAAVALTSQLPL